MDSQEARDTVLKLQTESMDEHDAAWELLRPLGAAVVPYLVEAYPRFKKWRGRNALVYHATRYARSSDEAFRLGILALNDKATVVRYRACALLAYSQRREAIDLLKPLLSHSDEPTRQDAAAAIDALMRRNHHHFHDRDHTDRLFWVVNDEDRAGGA